VGLLFKNNAETTLSSGINNSVTTVPVTSAAVFPTPTANDVFFATIDDGSNIEVVKVTGISSNDLTVVRAQDNTSAATFGSGAKIELRLTAKVLEMGTSSLTDLDGDTQVLVEEAADEDKIKLKAAGTEIARIDSTGLGIGGINPTEKLHVDGTGKFNGNVLLETAGKYFQVAGTSSTFWAVGSSGGSNPPGTASTTLAFHHWDGSAWNNEVEFNSSGDITLDGATYGGVSVPANRDIVLNAGTWSGEKSYKIQAHAGNLYLQSDYFFFRDAGGANNASIDSSGNAIFLNNVTAYGSPSDIKLKENIEVIDNALDKVKQLKGITYTLKSDGNRLTGLIAQDLEKVLPEAVYTSETIPDEINGIEAEEHLAIRYGNTVGLLVEAIKEQQKQIETLTAKVKELEDK
tara:strand:+ start:699 stop:1910 length:1212 start_codon:yes stop_codon:yes gene_type:complete